MSQVQKPSDLANQLFDGVLAQVKNDPREAAKVCINFLAEALVYVIASSSADDGAFKLLLKNVGETIIAAPRPPKP